MTPNISTNILITHCLQIMKKTGLTTNRQMTAAVLDLVLAFLWASLCL